MRGRGTLGCSRVDVGEKAECGVDRDHFVIVRKIGIERAVEGNTYVSGEESRVRFVWLTSATG